ncbi:YfjI family protein [Fundidesulfovibrio putealis]|uniref:YfjI family protein n=1 Tax=Fundidesulfovibrio putealis TaxID=270496 RepID=UPI0004847AF5|nr:YfjI family protein [Fundidesulfovibrio putealis]
MPEQITFGSPVLFEEQSPGAIPHDILPGVIGEFASAVSASIQVPFELPLLNALGAVAATSQRKYRVLIREGYTETLNIYGVAILPPGERKSAAKDACRAPLLEWEREQQRQTAEILKYAHAQRQVQEELTRVAIAKAKRCQDSSEQRDLIRQVAQLREEMESLPVAPRLLADDATPEGLAALMAQQDQRIAMIEAEGGFLDILAGRYSHGAPNLDAVLKSWSGEAVRIDRRHAEPILIEEPTLTLILSAQPDVLAGAAQTPAFRGRGLLGRMLFLLPKSLVGTRAVETLPIPSDLSDAYGSTLRNLLQLPWKRDAQGNIVPYLLPLSHEARAIWYAFANSIEADLADGGPLSRMRDWGGKLPGQTLRLAGLCHVTLHDVPQHHPISGQTLESAVKLAKHLIEHSRAVFSLMGADDSIECAKVILQWLRQDRLASFTGRGALEKVKGRWPKMALVNMGLTILEERGFILPRDHATGGRGRPSRVFLVNPCIHADPTSES